MSTPRRVLTVIVVVYVLVAFWVAKRCFDVFGYDSGDTADLNNMMWWTLHGKPFHVEVWGRSYFSIHAAFFWPIFIPLYVLIPSPYTLFFLQAAAAGLAAIPMFLIGRRVLENEMAGVFVAATLLFLPAIVSQHFNQVHNTMFQPVAVLFACYFFIERRFRLFVLWTFLSCLTQENVGLAVSMFGLWALAERRPWKWAVVPLISGGVYFVAAMMLIGALKGGESHVTGYFSYLGSNSREIVINALTKPQLIIRHLLEAQNVTYFVQLIQPMFWLLPFAHWSVLLALPDLAGNLISDNPAPKVIIWHYNVLTSTGLLVAAVFSLRKMTGLLRRRYGDASYAPVLASGLLVLTLAHWFLWFQPAYLIEKPYHDTLVKAVEFVPKRASVLSSVRIQGHFSGRPRYDSINALIEKPPEYTKNFEYILLDANERRYPPFVTREFFDSFYTNTNYDLVFAETNVFIFQRRDLGRTEGNR